jgi:predicted aldo/keto reductase-like oxidoreductase
VNDRPALSRRHLLTLGSVAAAVSPWLGARDALAKDAAATDAKAVPQVPRRTLGKTGHKIPILLLGGGSGFDPKFDPKIARALQHGVDYIDAARAYAGGTCETNAATTLERLKVLDKVWITSKSEAYDGPGLERNVEESLAALRRKSIDMYFLHGIEDPAILSDKALYASLDKLKKAGKIKYFGFSCHDGTVAELLTKAAGISAIDAVMFRYNFRTYGSKELNQAIDAAHKANIGLIAMKTQGSEASFQDAWKKFEQTGKWTKHQAVLKAVWSDPRITAAVSHMDSLDKLEQNIAAAVDAEKLGLSDWRAIEKYAQATRAEACDGCGHLCSAALGRPVDVATTLRCVMYHDVYGDADKARRVFSALPEAARDLAGADFAAANRACPHGVDIAQHMERARQILV